MSKHLLWLVVAGLLVCRFFLDFGESAAPIQIVVPYSAGGGTDTFARIIGKSLSERDELTAPIVIVNRNGGSATIGSRYVKDSNPDGNRILCHHEGIIATKLAGVVPYGAEAFRPVAQTGSIVLLMVVRADSPYQSLTDLLKAAQEEPNKIRVGANTGSPAYFICKQLLAEFPGAEFNFISAPGSKRVTFLMGDKLEAGIFSLAEYVSFRNSDDAALDDNILAIANFGEQRHPAIPKVKTSKEQGLKTSAENAYYFWAPKETPDETVNKLAGAFKAAVEDPKVIEALNKLSLDPKFRSGEELSEHLSKRVSAFEKLAVTAETSLPNFPAWMIGIVAALFGIVVLQSYREKSLAVETGPRSKQESQDRPFADKEHPQFNLTGVVCLTILIFYVIALGYGLPFVVVTAAAIFLKGGTIAKWKPGRLLALVQLALIVALSIELIFTKLFTVALP
jgi:tripartite-type tricarboxylate transporter receptor subunit TctC